MVDMLSMMSCELVVYAQWKRWIVGDAVATSWKYRSERMLLRRWRCIACGCAEYAML